MDMGLRLGVGCVRVSTDRQERSIDEQKEAIRAAANRDGVKLMEGEAWCEDEGISGSILARPGLQKLLAICHTRRDITDVYFWKRNRLTRSTDPLDGLSIEREIEKTGKRIHFVQGMQKTGNKLLDFIASTIEYAEAGQYLVNLSSDTIRGLVPLTKAGFDAGRPTPYGFDRMVVDSSGKELYRIRCLGGGTYHKMLPNGDVQVYSNGVKPEKEQSARSTLVPGAPDRVGVVRRMFAAYVQGEQGIRTIVENLNAERIPGPRGGLWSVGTIRSILVNPVYYGANIWNVRSFSKYHAIKKGAPTPHEPTDGRALRMNAQEDWIVADEQHSFEGLITKKLFDEAQEKRMGRNAPFKRGHSVKSPYYLTGLIKCACGHSLHGIKKLSSKKKGRRTYFYYTCGGFVTKGHAACKRYLVPKEVIEGPVLDALRDRLQTMGRIGNIREQVEALIAEHAPSGGDRSGELRGRLAELADKRRNWESAIDKGLDITLAVDKLKQLAKEEEVIKGDLAAIRARGAVNADVHAASTEILGQLNRLQEVLEEGSVAEVKAILRAYIGRIEYNPENNRARVGFLPSRALVSRLVLGRENEIVSMVAGGGFEPPTSGL